MSGRRRKKIGMGEGRQLAEVWNKEEEDRNGRGKTTDRGLE